MVKNSNKLKLKIILTALDLDIQAIADQVGESRQSVSYVINDFRPAKSARQKVAEFLSKQVTDLLNAENETVS